MKLCFAARRNIVQSRFSTQSHSAKIGRIPICVGKKQRLQASSLLVRVVLSSGNFTATFLLHNNRKAYKHAINGNCNCTSPSCLGQVTAKQPFSLRVKLPLAQVPTSLPHTLVKASHCPFLLLNCQAGKLC